MNAAETVASLGTILSVWAHPDDETYLAGGLMAAAVDLGQRVVCVSLTAGELGTSDPDLWPPARLGQVRRLEGAAAMAVLGVREHEILRFPDGGLSDCLDECTDVVGRLIEEVQPDTILTFGPDGQTFHPDHIAVHHCVSDAWLHGRRSRLLFATSTVERLVRFGHHFERWGVYMTEERPEGVPVAEVPVRLHLSDGGLDRKLSALRTMHTQIRPLEDAIGEELFTTLVAEESFVDAAIA